MDGIVGLQVEASDFPVEKILEDAFDNQLRLWRAISQDEIRVDAMIDELQIAPVSISEIEIRDRKLEALKAERTQISNRLAVLRSGMSEAVYRAIEIKLAVEEMTAARSGFVSNAGEKARQVEQIKLASLEVDALFPKQPSTEPSTAFSGASTLPAQVVAEAETVQESSIKKEGYLLKRKALVQKYSAAWPDIEGDLNHASENGLAAAAKATKHGDWYETSALAWATRKGKITANQSTMPANSVFNLPGKKHTSD